MATVLFLEVYEAADITTTTTVLFLETGLETAITALFLTMYEESVLTTICSKLYMKRQL